MVALVTGGGRGIGRAIAAAFYEAGAHVAICARTASELDETVALVRAAHPQRRGALLPIVCDVGSEASVARMAALVARELGAARVLVNNAGVVHRGRLDEISLEDFRADMDVNFYGTVLVSRALLPAMRQARAGRIINVASISGRQGTASLTAYCAAKHAVVGLTRALAEEVRDEGIQVNAICPGSVETRMLEGSPFSPDMQPGDIARVVLFLASAAPDALTGACLDVFG